MSISIHAPREGGDVAFMLFLLNNRLISIHAPREGGDTADRGAASVWIPFQSTPPARGATSAAKSYQRVQMISIHAPREGGDHWLVVKIHASQLDFNPRPPRGGRLFSSHLTSHRFDFNPRPPRGGRRIVPSRRSTTLSFQSTPPARGATKFTRSQLGLAVISIHAPREGGDSCYGILHS